LALELLILLPGESNSMSSVVIGSLTNGARGARDPDVDAGEILPDGLYQAVVEDAEMARGGRPGHYVVTYNLRVLGPICAGQRIEKTSLISEKSLGQARRELAACGLELEQLSDLQDQLLEVIDAELDIRILNSRGEMEVRFLKPTGEEEDDD
jgi:hypothetical protein